MFPITKRFKSETPFPEEIEDTFAFSQFSEEVSQEVVVVIERPQGFDRSLYTIYADNESDLREETLTSDQAWGVLAENPEKRKFPGRIPPQQGIQARKVERKSSTQGLAQHQHQIIETFEKELSSQGSSSRVILVYERTAVIPDSQGVSPSSLSYSGPCLEFSSSQEQRIPETQAEVEIQETIDILGELQAIPLVSQESVGAREALLSNQQEHNPKEITVSSENIQESQSTQILLGETLSVDLNPRETADRRQRFSDILGPTQLPSARPESPQTTQSFGSTSAEPQDLKDLQSSGDLQEPPHFASVRKRSIQIRELPELSSLLENSTQEETAIISTLEVTVTNPLKTSATNCDAGSVCVESPDQGPAATSIEPQVLAPRQVHESAGDSNQTTSIPLVEPPRKPHLLPNTVSRRYSENPPIEAFESWFANNRRRRAAKPTARATNINRSRVKRASTFPVSLSTTNYFSRGRYSRHSLPPSMKAMSNNPPATSPSAVSGVAALRERLARSREERNAKVAATRNARNTLSMSPHAAANLRLLSRSPSVTPTEQTVVNPAAPVGFPEAGVEVMREHSVLAVSQSFPRIGNSSSTSSTAQNGEILQQTPFGPPQLGPAEWVIGLPLRTKSVTPNGIDQKKAYLDSIVGKHAEIERFLSNPEGADSWLVKTMQDVVEASGRIATHPDLPFDKVGISVGVPGKEAEYHAAMSSKFVFLRAFLGAVKGLFLKIVIVAEEGKLIVGL